MRRALVILAIVAVAAVALDFGLRTLAEDRVGDQLRRSMGLRRRPDVSLSGFPFLVHFASGAQPSVSVDAGPDEYGGVALEDVRLTLRDVSFAPGQLLLGRPSTIRAEGGTGSATLTAEAVNRALGPDGPLSLSFVGDRVLINLESPSAEVEARVDVSDGRLVLTPVRPELPLSLSFELPKILPGLRYTEVRVSEPTASLSFRLGEVSLEALGSGTGLRPSAGYSPPIVRSKPKSLWSPAPGWISLSA